MKIYHWLLIGLACTIVTGSSWAWFFATGLISELIRNYLIGYYTKKRDRQNFRTIRGAALIKAYNKRINILRGYWT